MVLLEIETYKLQYLKGKVGVWLKVVHDGDVEALIEHNSTCASVFTADLVELVMCL